MNNLTPSAPEDLSSQIAALRRQSLTLLLALIVVSGTLTVCLFQQARQTGHDLAQEKQIIANLKDNRPMIDSFVKELAVYGNKNPDFAQQVLKKYGIVPGAPTAPAAPAAPKK